MMELVDTHCHIQSIGLSEGEKVTRELWADAKDLTRDMAVTNAVEAGVTRLLCVGCDLEDSRLAVDFVQDQAQCWASIGLHPHEAKLYAGQQDKLDEFAALVTRPKVVAVGECGFDFYYNHSPKEAQAEILRFQIELALEHDLPMIFHVREAFDDFWPVFDSYSGIRGVLHSFTDSPDNARRALDKGLHVGVNGIATFTKSADQIEVYRSIPLDRLLLETDSPFLTPTPYRGTINEPKRLGAVADFLAELRGESPKVLAEATTANARKLFGI
ncbi:MAG: TatD family hydrolase [Patescibacteria group bacterium]